MSPAGKGAGGTGDSLPDPDKPKANITTANRPLIPICRTMLFRHQQAAWRPSEAGAVLWGDGVSGKSRTISDEAEGKAGGAGQKLEELTLKIEDVETLLDDVSDAAYDKAVEVVADAVGWKPIREDIRLVEESK